MLKAPSTKTIIRILLMVTICLSAGCKQPATIQSFAIEGANKNPLVLWYRQPANQWVEALPVSNGRLGAIVFGGINNERIQLNEDTLWSGGPYDPTNPDAAKALPGARRLIFAGDYDEAQKLVGSKMMGRPVTQMPYQPAGDLILNFQNISDAINYKRQLNLDTAIARVDFSCGDVNFTREVFSSPVDQVIVVRLAADRPGQVTFTAGLKPSQKSTIEIEKPDTLVMRGVNRSQSGINGALRFQTRLRVLADGGKISPDSNSITVTNADSVTLLIAIATSYKSYKDVTGDPESLTKKYISQAVKKSYQTLRDNHIAEHQRLFGKVKLDLGKTEAVNRPADERIKAFANTNDPQLAALYFQFGRYLLISSSRPGGQPANLQGLWNESVNPPWDSKYTININTEMNYWPAEPTNLAECVEPLIAMIKDLSETGAHTAKVNWDANGWVCNHNTDLWRATAPIDGPKWGFWPTGGAWLCKHLWDHYEYNCDKKYLAGVYPVMKGSAQFFLETLVEEPNKHYLVTCPSLSPENTHPYGANICAGPTMDSQILRDLFTNCINASQILDVDNDFRQRLITTRERLAPNQIGGAGQLQEWLYDWDMQAPEIHHRHVSHLYGLYPSDQISFYGTPRLAAAARKSLEIRGDEATGWGTAWRLNLWARLHDGEHCFEILKMLISPQRTYPNMFDSCPPFQIDGNFGGTSGITEMLVQCCNGEIELLPALPEEWPDGSVSGLCVKGGFEVNITWKKGKLYNATINSKCGNTVRLRTPVPVNVTLNGKSIEVTWPETDMAVFQTKAQQVYNLSAD